MEDSTATTIEFLRARLLAERSVSKTARQRAYELAKRVTELEKELTFVSLQRKKAEKAAVDVLAILENHGRNDLSETFDSSSDQEEMSSGSKDGTQREKTEHVKVRESDAEGFSGSEVESSSGNGRSLSWKSSKNPSSRFLEKKCLDASRRRRNSFTSTGSSPRRVGKSCRQIKRREQRSVADGSENDDTSNVHHEDDGRSSSEGVENPADVAIESSIEELRSREEKDPPEVPTSSSNGHTIQNHRAERDMERALEHQAQFIARYEAEEKTQREWEDKFRENNGSTPDSCDPGTHSDVTEERDEIKAPPPPPASAPAPAPAPPHSTEKHTSESREIDVGAADANFSEEPKIDTDPLLDQKSSGMSNEVLDNQNHPPDLQGTPRNFSPAQAAASQDSSLLYRGEQTSGKSDEPTFAALENPKNPDKLGSVLEALEQAKLSLKQNLEKFPLLESGPSIPTYRSGDKFPVPFSPAELFRLPTDYQCGGETTSRANSLRYDSRLTLTNYLTEPSGGQFISSPYRESLSRSTASLDDQFRMVPTFPYQETRLGIHTQFPSAINPRLDVGPPARDPRLDVWPPARDPRLSVRPPALDSRLDMGVGPSGSNSKLGVGTSTVGPSLDVGLSAFDPRVEMGTPFTGDRYVRSSDRHHSSPGLPTSSTYGRIPRSLPGAEPPLRSRSLYDDYTGPNTYG